MVNRLRHIGYILRRFIARVLAIAAGTLTDIADTICPERWEP